MSPVNAQARPPITISVKEAAQMLGISKSHAYDLIRQDQLPHVRLGRRVVVPYRELEEWVRRRIGGDGYSDDASRALPSAAAADASAAAKAWA
jgi:excisionase family DNA binding protein